MMYCECAEEENVAAPTGEKVNTKTSEGTAAAPVSSVQPVQTVPTVPTVTTVQSSPDTEFRRSPAKTDDSLSHGTLIHFHSSYTCYFVPFYCTCSFSYLFCKILLLFHICFISISSHMFIFRE